MASYEQDSGSEPLQLCNLVAAAAVALPLGERVRDPGPPIQVEVRTYFGKFVILCQGGVDAIWNLDKKPPIPLLPHFSVEGTGRCGFSGLRPNAQPFDSGEAI